MNIKMLFSFMAILITSNCFAQYKNINTSDNVTDVLKVTIINPGVAYEKRIGKFQTVIGQLFINTSISSSLNNNNTTTPEVTLYFDPAISLQYRYYYNYERRSDNDKRTDMNSMNYVGVALETFFSKINLDESFFAEQKRRAINSIGVIWGIQRNYHKRFSLDLNFGLGYRSTSFTKTTGFPPSTSTVKTGRISSIGQLNLGIWLNKRK
jgi:hypothetical protein